MTTAPEPAALLDLAVSTAREAAEQAKLFPTEDFREGVAAAAERRPPRFSGR